jgi:glycosyltransferase involved in cell wall biosynthesis
MRRAMKVLHVVASLDPRDGGAVRVVTELTQVLAEKGVEITIFAPSRQDKRVRIVNQRRVKVVFFPTGFFARYWAGYSRLLADALKKEAAGFDLIHTHGIWYYPQFAVYQATKGQAKPIVASIHGELSPGNLWRAAFKKKIFSALVQRKIFKAAAAIHAVSPGETEDIVRFVGNVNIAVIPNGVNPSEFIGPRNGAWIKKRYPHLQGKKVILFLGRISTGKGLDILAQAFGHVARELEDVCLLVVGPDHWGYKSTVEKILVREGIVDKVIFTGMLTGKEKKAALDSTDIFVLPSLSEGFSMALLEAMLSHLPVVISPQCNFAEVATAGAGKIVAVDVDPLAKTLIELLKDRHARQEMGKRGAKLVREKYTWDIVADRMLALYQGLIR